MLVQSDEEYAAGLYTFVYETAAYSSSERTNIKFFNKYLTYTHIMCIICV